jgi:hypothetical protein
MSDRPDHSIRREVPAVAGAIVSVGAFALGWVVLMVILVLLWATVISK